MGNKAIQMELPRMFIKQDPRLNQYLAAIHSKGYSLRTISEVAYVSYETVRLRILKASEEQNAGYIADLSGLPGVTTLPRHQRATPAPYFMSDEVKRMLLTANTEAQKYRKGSSPLFAQAFNSLVLELVGQGVPFTAIAEACGQSPQHLRRRLARWDVRTTRRPKQPKLVLSKPEGKAPKPKPPEPLWPCKYPDCPSYEGGTCIHQPTVYV